MFNDPPGLHIITLLGLFLDAGSGHCARMQHWLLRLESVLPLHAAIKGPRTVGQVASLCASGCLASSMSQDTYSMRRIHGRIFD